ncbi:hypothetical protein DXD22_04700 [Ruminococcus sp. TF12-19AC]|jgi:hypothetical protein|nr:MULTISPECIES: hypothetical protein [Ruminococcus]RGI08577.1 hypothetical protein DXD22_04700 [Ruminococcus sp. TF12-19AC]
MLLSIVFIIIIVFAIVFIIMKACDSSDILKIIIAILSIASVITFFIIASKSVSYTGNIKMSEKIESTQKIVNLKDNRDTKGHFFIGTGYVGTETYYYYYYQTKSGSYKANKIETDKCEIIYTNDTPHIDTIVQVPDEEQTKNWLTLSWMLSIRTSFSSDKYKIYVPEGTITDDFSIDME